MTLTVRAMTLGGWLLLLVFVAGPGSPALAKDQHALSEADAKELVAKAASVSQRFMNTVAALGAKLSLRNLLEPKTDVPMTLVVFVLAGRNLDDRDVKLLKGATPSSFYDAIYPHEVQAGQRVPKHPYASILHEEYVQDISVQVNGRTATGGVRFRAPGAYEGFMNYTAYRDASGWRVLELSLPHSEVRTTLENGRWRLKVPASMSAPTPLRGKQVDVPRVGTLGPLPAENTRTVISVTRDGYIRVPGERKPLSLMALQRYLQRKAADPRLRQADGASKLDALLDVDKTIPWVVTQWIMQTCAHPNVKIYKIWMGAQTKDGKDGAIATVLPRDRGLRPTAEFPKEFHKIKVKCFKLTRLEQASDIRALYAALEERQEQIGRRDDTVFEVVAPPPKGGRVPHGYIVQVIDACLAAGARNIIFEGAPLTRDAMAGSAELLKRHIDILRQTPGVPVLKINNDPSPIGRVAAGAAVMPARGLLKTRWGAGAQVMAGVVVEELEETPEEGLEEEGLKDEPFEGPPSGGSIGIGGGAGGAFRGRGGKKQLTSKELAQLWARQDACVDSALRWLAAHQSPNGGWEANGFENWCDGKPYAGKKAKGQGKALYDPGVTGLALQAFLGAGYTNRGRHPFAKVVSRGLRYLKNIQDPEGCFGPRSTQQYIYSHAMAAVAMVEAYGMTGSPIFKGSAQRALDFIAMSRNPYFAWRYGIKPGDNDTSVTAWMVLALRSAKSINVDAVKRGKAAPLTIDESAFDGAKAWLDKVTDKQTGAAGYVQRGTGPARPKALVDKFPGRLSESMTAAAVFTRMLAGQDPRKNAVMQKGLARIAAKPPAWKPKAGTIDMYYWHWGTLALYQAGGKRWQAWRRTMVAAIMDQQRKDTDFCGSKGSWDPIGPWGPDGGRVYSTALMALTLQVRYRYSRYYSGK